MSADNGLSQGIVKWYNSTKAFGFITLPEGGFDVFVHANQLRKSGILREPVPGEKLKFRIEVGDKGKFATDISFVEAPKE